MVAEADLVVVVEPSHQRRLQKVVGVHETPVLVLGDLDPGPISSRRIRDPWGDDLDVFHEVFDRIDRCVDELLRTTSRPAARG
jgi:protein-tyrosine-phosphatase